VPGVPLAPAAVLDIDANGLEDIWELSYQPAKLIRDQDPDGDGFTNEQESTAGTDALDRTSHPQLEMTRHPSGEVQLSFSRVAGKRYELRASPDAGMNGGQTYLTDLADSNAPYVRALEATGESRFFQLLITDVDSDADGLTDSAERNLGLNPLTDHSDRQDESDLQRVNRQLNLPSTVTLGVLDPWMSERWPDPGVVAVRRSGGIGGLTVNFELTGTAVDGVDYRTVATRSLRFAPGVRERWIELHPLPDSGDDEGPETIVVALLPGPGYTLGTTPTVALTLRNETESSKPSEKAAARFLLQAAFGPDQDSTEDADEVPENVEQVMELGFAGWIEDQFTRPLGLIEPWVTWATFNGQRLALYGNWKENSWWNRAMGVPKLRPDSLTEELPDPLRQRVAFALSQILVISDRPEQLGPEQRGMANYYDLMVKHAFGNYRDLLYDVALHPAMGIYLSHVGNRKADSTKQTFPDENFAREIMQLFSIGLWELNPDGSRQLGPEGRPIPTYDNRDITELARVFTGLSFGNNEGFLLYPRDLTVPMRMWDAFHDCDPKVLLRRLELPLRSPSPGKQGTAGLADVNAAIDLLFQHPNTGPFIGRQLIQRLITSNPSTGYVARVSAAFADNGQGVRGDLRAVIRAILLDSEARSSEPWNRPEWGKLREPFLRCVNLARAFNASSPSGWYPLDQFQLDHLQDPLNAPSVFNFYLPTHSPAGPLTQQGFVAPEFQLINASSTISGPNYFYNAILGDLHRWGSGNTNYSVRLNLLPELAMIVPAHMIGQHVPPIKPMDPDPLLRRLDLALTAGRLTPPQFQIVREAMERIPTSTWQWHKERLRLAIYLVVTSSDFNVLQ
jgi:uncharacterized protein (DUF1800 family)